MLTRSDPAAISIGDLAFEYGFPETGRFAAYYRAQFGETPSETLRSRGVSTHHKLAFMEQDQRLVRSVVQGEIAESGILAELQRAA